MLLLREEQAPLSRRPTSRHRRSGGAWRLRRGAHGACVQHKDPLLRGVFWERCVAHSIRPSFIDGFLFPYRELLAASAGRPVEATLGDFVAFAPNDFFANYSFARASRRRDCVLVECDRAAPTWRTCVKPGPWGDALQGNES